MTMSDKARVRRNGETGRWEVWIGGTLVKELQTNLWAVRFAADLNQAAIQEKDLAALHLGPADPDEWIVAGEDDELIGTFLGAQRAPRETPLDYFGSKTI
jgi:hypothetical protein